MMTRYTQIGQQSVYVVHTVVAHPVAEVSEVAPHEGETLVVHDVLFSILVLIETVQMTLFAQSAEYLLAVAATTEGYVYINTIGLDVKPVDALL